MNDRVKTQSWRIGRGTQCGRVRRRKPGPQGETKGSARVPRPSSVSHRSIGFGRERRRQWIGDAPEPQVRRPSSPRARTPATWDSPLLWAFCQSWRLGDESVASVGLFSFELQAEPDEAIGWVVENAEDGCPVRRSQGNDHDLVRSGLLKDLCRLNGRFVPCAAQLVNEPADLLAVERQSRDMEHAQTLGAESFACSPFLLLEQHGSELARPFGAVDEHLEDVVASGDGEGEHGGFSVVGGLEPFGGVIEACVSELEGEREDSFVVDRDAGEEHVRGYTCSCRRVSVRKGHGHERQAVTLGAPVEPDAVLTRSDLAELGYPRRAIDIIIKNVMQDGAGVQVLPGFSRPMITVRDFLAFRDRCTFRDNQVVPR